MEEFGHAELGPGAVSLGSVVSAAVAILMILDDEDDPDDQVVTREEQASSYSLKLLPCEDILFYVMVLFADLVQDVQSCAGHSEALI